jgi:hypothetical protein
MTDRGFVALCVLAGVLVVLALLAPWPWADKPPLVTCLDSERAGCPSWCWTCGADPCESNGGVKRIHGGGLFGPHREYICNDGTVE